MPLIARELALLAKIETTYKTDAVPTGGANAVLARDVEVDPLVIERQDRELYRPFLGNSTDVVGAFYGRIRFKVEAAGPGAAGTVPAYGPLHRGCGLAEVNSPGVNTVYTPITSSMEALTLYLNLSGVLHKFVGARGNLGFEAEYRQAPMWTYDFMGVFVPVTDTALPAVTTTAYQAPLAFNFQNTPTFLLHSVATLALKSFRFDLGAQVAYRNLVNSESVRITDRKPTVTMEFLAEAMSVKNWFTTVRDATLGGISLVHGTAAGNTISMTVNSAQLMDAVYGVFEGDRTLRVTAKPLPSGTGNDEFSILAY